MEKMMTANISEEAKKFKVDLDDFPEFSAQLGVLISCFALVENYMHEIITRCTSMDKAEAFFVSGSFSSFGARITLLETLMKSKNSSLHEVIAAKHFVTTFKEASRIRNDYAHGQYSLRLRGTPKEKIMIITSFLYDAKKKAPKEMERDIEGIKKDVARIKFIICELHGYVYRDEMPVS